MNRTTNPTCKTCGGPIRWAQRNNGSWYAAIPVPTGDGELPGSYWRKVARRPHTCGTYLLAAERAAERAARADRVAAEAEDTIAAIRGRGDLSDERKAHLIETLTEIIAAQQPA